ncbi:IclR family transcriptional regulator C-terminal domain-containing protein [Variovorax sp. PCZ-1]|uniref:IclR family transcriptional regulator domain-containing protein n=1 Tax=Variovorax sp. PCZ-1 TaxID=2835533 RepID=UPI001BCEB2DA|nr:IclR family transcriptional regulator C-terminal domain-containing protein [Variovorax sp. PCZ-1]MBS7806422.1 helix-turn-helix domain-containing protein [Variovorax sp. PCZ-1]
MAKKTPLSSSEEATLTVNEAQTTQLPLLRRDWIAGLEKGLELLRCFDEEHSRVSASEMADLTGMTRTAVRRYLLTLAHLGYLATDGKLFWLTPRVLQFSQAYLASSRLVRVAQPFLQRIAQGTGENAFLSVMEGDSVVYIARQGSSAASLRPQNIGYMLGMLVPAHVTAAGTLLLALRAPQALDAWLAKIKLKTLTAHSITDKAKLRKHLLNSRLQDWAISEQQLELHFRGVAVPVRDIKGDVIAALSVTMYIGNEAADQASARVLGVMQEAASGMRNLV